jgi:hypothetical protein
VEDYVIRIHRRLSNINPKTYDSLKNKTATPNEGSRLAKYIEQ